MAGKNYKLIFALSDGSEASVNFTAPQGDTGATGADGVGIKSVVQTTTSSEDGGSNVITVTKTDNTTSTFVVKNGSKGSTGADGADGYTPVKGVDYWTEADQESIVQQVIAALGTPVFGTVDADNNIILSGELANGTYTIKYEYADGNLMNVGEIALGGYTNSLPSAVGYLGTVFNDVGYVDGYYLTSNANVSGNNSYLSSDATHFTTGFIPYEVTDWTGTLKPIYVKGITLDTASIPSHTRFAVYPSYTHAESLVPVPVSEMITAGAMTVEQLGDNYYKFQPTAECQYYSQFEFDSIAYMRMSLPGSGDGVIISIGNPIEGSSSSDSGSTDSGETTYTNLFVADTASLNTRMSGSSSTSKAADGYVMTATIPLAAAITSSYDDNTSYVAVPASMWTSSANIFITENGTTKGYISASTTAGTTVGNWVKIPLYDEWGQTFTTDGVIISLYVSASAITASDIQNLQIYFNECPA